VGLIEVVETVIEGGGVGGEFDELKDARVELTRTARSAGRVSMAGKKARPATISSVM